MARPVLICAALFAAATAAGTQATHAAATSPSAGLNPTQLFGAHPAQQGRTTLPGGHFNFALAAGASIADGVVVVNLSDHALDFHVYGADLRTASGGGLAPAQPGDTMHETGAWITVSTPRVTIAEHSEFTDNFTLTLPSTVSPGQHLGAVVAAATVGTTPQGASIEARTALITVVTVPGTAHPSGSLNPLTGSTAVPGQVGFAITLSNTGNLLLTYAGSVAIYDADGRKVASLPATPPDAYVVPAGQVALAATWPQAIPSAGRYSAQATVTILADGTPVATLTSQSLTLPWSSGIPLPIIVGIAAMGVVIVLLATWSIVRSVRGRRRTHAGGLARELSRLR